MTSPFAHLLDDVTAPDPLAAQSAHLALAYREALRGVGRTAPNPPVGAVVARGDDVLSRGHHARAGEPHGEIVALDALPRGSARGADLYVTLEPCVHQGRTPPCVDRVLADGIARVVVGAVDPNPKVHEKGIAQLRAKGVRVDVAGGAAGARCQALIRPFGRALVDGMPWVTLKIASSLDGRVAAAGGISRWITGPPARALVHRLRDACDAVVVGAGTVIADDPQLTARDVPGGRNPRRVVIDRQLRTAPSAHVYSRRAKEAAPVVVHLDSAPADAAAAFDEAGVERVVVDDLRAALRALVPLGVMAVLVEAGPGLATALLRDGLVDELWWFHAPLVVGGDGVPAVGALNLTAPSDGPRFATVHRTIVGEDSLVVLKPLP